MQVLWARELIWVDGGGGGGELVDVAVVNELCERSLTYEAD